jgi:glyoxylase-like metal-dependent hydrolase (beta-lactamase superfamily II)
MPPPAIQTITLALPFKLGSVNCYLINTGQSYVLIDSGSASQRRQLDEELARAGCQPGMLTLIFLTHGDFDHTGNAAHLRAKFGAKIGMHADDCGMAQHGDMFWNRQSGNAVTGMLAAALFRFGKASRFAPDLLFEDGDALTAYGLIASVVTLPGHSKGSLGVLTADGDLFCGDLFENPAQPVLNSIIDDPIAAQASVEKLKGLAVQTVYPGHGKPFAFDALA